MPWPVSAPLMVGEVTTEFSRVFLGEKEEQVYNEGKTLRKPKVTLKMISGIKFLHFYEESS